MNLLLFWSTFAIRTSEFLARPYPATLQRRLTQELTEGYSKQYSCPIASVTTRGLTEFCPRMHLLSTSGQSPWACLSAACRGKTITQISHLKRLTGRHYSLSKSSVNKRTSATLKSYFYDSKQCVKL